MKPAPFSYVRAATAGEAIDLIDADPEAKLLAGGQSLLPLMNLRLARPTTLVDIGGLAELDRVFDDGDGVLVGAAVRHRTFERHPLLVRRLPLVAAGARHIGHVAIRNQGTLGGTLAHADPTAEMPLVMVTLGATFSVESRCRGRREVPAEEFFLSHFTTALHADELLTWVRVPALGAGEGWGFVEYARRQGDFAITGAACVVRLGCDGLVERVRAGLMNSGGRPLLVSTGSTAVGQRPDDRLWLGLARDWSRHAMSPNNADDAAYVRDVACSALTGALRAASRRAQGRAGEETR